MKKIFTFSALVVTLVMLLASCTKRDHYDNYSETGIVDYVPNYYSPYFIVYLQSDGSYAIVKSLDGPSYWPIENERVYGDFNYNGQVTLKNIDAGFDMYVTIVGFRNNRNNAIYDLESYEDQEGYGASAVTNNKLSVDKSRIRIKN